jgi:hypothetical protein
MQQSPFNDVIGTPVLGYFDLGFSGSLRLSPDMEFVTAVGLTHCSNGRIRTPNMGMDLVGLKFGMILYPRSLTRKEVTPAKKTTSAGDPAKRPLLPDRAVFWNLTLAGGVNSADHYDAQNPLFDVRGPQYTFVSLAVEWERKYGGVGAYGFGLNVIHDPSIRDGYTTPVSATFAGLTISHELLIHRMGILTQVGLAPWNTGLTRQRRGIWYLRVGARIRITPHCWALLALKTMDSPSADFVEWGLGYSFQAKRKR